LLGYDRSPPSFVGNIFAGTIVGPAAHPFQDRRGAPHNAVRLKRGDEMRGDHADELHGLSLAWELDRARIVDPPGRRDRGRVVAGLAVDDQNAATFGWIRQLGEACDGCAVGQIEIDAIWMLRIRRALRLSMVAQEGDFDLSGHGRP